MIYITGDCHGDYRRFNTKNFPEQKQMTKKDYVIITGDFGFWKNDKEQQYWLRWLKNKSFTTLWIDGNHENFDLLSTYPCEMWHDGEVQFINSSVIHLRRGQVYHIDGCKIFTFGGASSHDISKGVLELDDPLFHEKKKRLDRMHQPYRINHISWWKEELPSQEEYRSGIENLEKCQYKVDYMITHCCASQTQSLIADDSYETNELTEYLEKIKTKTSYQKWFFGHYHQDQIINDKEILLYKKVLRIW